MRLSAAHRLRAASEFSRVREQGVSRAGKYVVINVLPLPEGGRCRFGIITSRKVGNAVQRNRVRRRLREIIRACTPREAVWVVTVARRPAADAAFRDLQQDWLRTVKRLGGLQDEVQGPSTSRPEVAPPAPS
jgi:ribonuclease P protein component